MKTITTIITSDNKKFTDMAKAEAHEASLTYGPKINAWMDANGMPDGKAGRRKSLIALISKWEADKASGAMDKVEVPAQVEEVEEPVEA